MGGLQRELLLFLHGEEGLEFQPGILQGTGSSPPGDQWYLGDGNGFLRLWGSPISLQIPKWLTYKQCCCFSNILVLKERKDLWLWCYTSQSLQEAEKQRREGRDEDHCQVLRIILQRMVGDSLLHCSSPPPLLFPVRLIWMITGNDCGIEQSLHSLPTNWYLPTVKVCFLCKSNTSPPCDCSSSSCSVTRAIPCSCLDISFSVSFQCLLPLSAEVPQLCWWNKEPCVPLQVLSWGQGHVWSLEKWVVLITGALRHIYLSRAEILIWFCSSQGLLAQVQWTWTVSSPWTEVALCDVLWRITKPSLCLIWSMYQALTFA